MLNRRFPVGSYAVDDSNNINSLPKANKGPPSTIGMPTSNEGLAGSFDVTTRKHVPWWHPTPPDPRRPAWGGPADAQEHPRARRSLEGLGGNSAAVAWMQKEEFVTSSW